MKKILSVILILIFTLTLASCSVSDAPEGMQDATVAGEPFRLFVPKTFTLNTASGISGAYMAFDAEYANAVIVTARHYTPAEAITLDEYLTMLQEGFANSVDGDIIHKFDPSFPQNVEPSSSKESVAISSGMAAFFKSSEIFAPRSIALSYSKFSSGVMRRLIFSAIARRRKPAAL